MSVNGAGENLPDNAAQVGRDCEKDIIKEKGSNSRHSRYTFPLLYQFPLVRTQHCPPLDISQKLRKLTICNAIEQ